MELTKIKYSVDAGIAVAQMDFKKNLNAIDEVMADELMAVVEAAEKDSDVKVLVLKGGEPRHRRPSA